MGTPPNKREWKWSQNENKWVMQKCENGGTFIPCQTNDFGGNSCFYIFQGWLTASVLQITAVFPVPLLSFFTHGMEKTAILGEPIHEHITINRIFKLLIQTDSRTHLFESVSRILLKNSSLNELIESTRGAFPQSMVSQLWLSVPLNSITELATIVVFEKRTPDWVLNQHMTLWTVNFLSVNCYSKTVIRLLLLILCHVRNTVHPPFMCISHNNVLYILFYFTIFFIAFQ